MKNIKTNLKKEKHTIKPYQKKVIKPWGYEIIFTRHDSPTVGKILHLKTGKRFSLQYHDEKTETQCLIKGKAIMALSDKKGNVKKFPMKLHKGYSILPGQIHRVTAITDIDIIETSTPELGNTYRLEDDNNRPTEDEKMRKTKNRGLNL